LHGPAIRVGDPGHTQPPRDVDLELVWRADYRCPSCNQPLECVIDIVRPEGDLGPLRSSLNVKPVISPRRLDGCESEDQALELDLDVVWWADAWRAERLSTKPSSSV
jgi:hypothetical protein